jgi:hypothetical protein
MSCPHNMAGVSVVIQPSKPLLSYAFKNAFKNLVFRRVKSVHTHAPRVFDIHELDDNGQVVITQISQSNQHTITREKMEQNVVEKCSSYYFFTQTSALRDNDPCGKAMIHGIHSHKVDFVIGGAYMGFVPCIPRDVMPRVGDLVCGMVAETEKGYTFTQWLICSDQFFHAWTAILYPDCEALRRNPNDDENKIRRYLMSGNRLCTNSYLKYQEGCKDSNVDFSLEERRKRFYALRTEIYSVSYVHVYAALVLMIRYGDIPNEHNVPNNLNQDPKLKTWNLPNSWLNRILECYRIVVDTEPVPTPTPIPADTVTPKPNLEPFSNEYPTPSESVGISLSVKSWDHE